MNQSIFRLLFLAVAFSNSAQAEFVDQFTNRNVQVADSIQLLNSQMISEINLSLDVANHQGFKCNDKQESIANDSRDHLLTVLRNIMLENPIDHFAETTKKVSKFQTPFKNSIFNDVYSPAWINHWAGKAIDTEPILNVDGHQITTKKLARFVSDGFLLYQNQVKNQYDNIEQTEKKSFEDAKKFMNSTGVLSYAEHSAKLAGYRFWNDLCGASVKTGRCQPGKLISCDNTTGKWTIGKAFNFNEYIDDSWDEAINCSMYAADFSLAMTKKIQKVTGDKHLPCPVDPVKCLELSTSKSKKYLSPICAEVADKLKKALPAGLFTDYTFKPSVHDSAKTVESRK